jgi:hypothetical protein
MPRKSKSIDPVKDAKRAIKASDKLLTKLQKRKDTRSIPLLNKAKKYVAAQKKLKFRPVRRGVHLSGPPGVDHQGTVNAFHTCWNLFNDPDVFTNLSGLEISVRKSLKEHYWAAFRHNEDGGPAAYKEWWHKLNFRTDISEDDRMEIQGHEEEFARLINIYDNLHAQGLI